MGMKLFEDAGDDDLQKISQISINKEFAKRYEHNKKREDLQKLEEMKKKGLIDDSGSESESESESDEEDDGDIASPKKAAKFFDGLLKVRKKDPTVYQKDAKLFESSDEEDGDDVGEKREKEKKPKYLKDVVAQHLIEEGPEFDDQEEDEKSEKKRVKSFAEEQEDLRKSVLAAMAEAERENDDGGDLLREKDRREDDADEDEDDEEFNEKLDEFFGDDEKLDENNKFLKYFFKDKQWKDRDTGKSLIDEDEMEAVSDDEEAIERQEDYEREFNFRFEENVSDRVLGHSRFVEGSVRKETNARKQQRERKKERMAQAEVERQEEVKRLKNLKKKEIQEKLDKIRQIAGVGNDGIPLTEEDLEEDFDPEEFDKKMKAAFGDEYYEAHDADPEFGSDVDEGGSDLEKPDFDKEDELLGLPKDWDVIKSSDGFNAERERRMKNEVGSGSDDELDDENDNDQSEPEEDENDHDQSEPEEDENDNDQSEPEEGKRKRKRKLSLKEKVALDKELEELYKLDYEDAIGDLKTRFKYRPVAPRKYGLNAAEILMMDEKELNQYVSLKKLAPYREKEWKVHPMQRHQFMKKKGLLLQGLANGQMNRKKRRRTDGVGESSKERGSQSQEDVKAPGEQLSNDESKLSRNARRRRRMKEKKLSQERLKAYGQIPTSSKHKSKS